MTGTTFNATPARVYEQLWRTILARQSWSGTLVNRTKWGGDYLAELTIAPVIDRDGDLKYFLGMHRDVTKVHELEGAVHQQKARLETGTRCRTGNHRRPAGGAARGRGAGERQQTPTWRCGHHGSGLCASAT
ncbi:PAS domain-containing protein [Allochromatium tepidum]|uniref:PAS domain-containing protein n=1 Tax=Allochromatium tepidum TaxID=553982 RepID=UPI001EFFB067|nr:PAS domain-containing protein [Allochromatium tepidum]